MKKKAKFLLFLAAVCLLAGFCLFTRPKIRLPENPRVYEQKLHEDGYAYLAYENRIFVPYCPCEAEYLGDCIGYCDVPASDYSDANRVYVCELSGYSPDEWIVDIMDINCSEGMIWKEINAADIPEGLVSEYEWNQ